MRIFRYFSVLCRPWCRPLASSSILPCDDLTVTPELEPSPPGMQAGNVICLSRNSLSKIKLCYVVKSVHVHFRAPLKRDEELRNLPG